MEPDLVKVFAEEYTNHINELRKTRNARISLAKKELKKLETDKAKLTKAITEGFHNKMEMLSRRAYGFRNG